MDDGTTNITIESGESLTHRLAREAGAANPGVWQRYRQMLADDVADDQQFEEFKGLLPLLHKTPADVDRDRALIVSAKQLVATIKGGRGLRAAAERATKALEQKEADFNRVVKAQQAEIAPLRSAKAQIVEKQKIAFEACQELANLKRENADVLADFPDVDPSKLD